MPRPLSSTLMTSPGRMITLIEVQYPAIASSMLLSTTSYTRWWSPRADVDPMYIPGRFRTASRPLSTWICREV